MILPKLSEPISRINEKQTQLNKVWPQAMLRLSPTFGSRTGGLNFPRNMWDGGGALSFTCGRAICSCSGDDDCNDMFGSSVCGDLAVCDETGETKCWCLRW